jgi:hypothetical protein
MMIRGYDFFQRVIEKLKRKNILVIKTNRM